MAVQINGGGLANKGAIPKTVGVLSPNNPLGTGTSVARSPTYPTPTGQAPQIQHGTPSTPVKSIVTPDGTTTTYHAPATNKGKTSATPSASTSGTTPGILPTTSADKYSRQTGQLNPGYFDTNTPAPALENKPTTYTPQDLGVNGVSQGGLIGNAVAQSQNPSAAYTVAQENANKINQQIEDAKAQMAKQTSDINQSGTWTSRALGEQGQANIQNAATLSALGSQYQGAQQQLGAANTQQGLQQSALGTAIGANAPMQVPYSNQVISPSNINGGGTGQVGQLPQQATDYINSLAQAVKEGRMTRGDAESRISTYSQPGLQALNTALGSSFNTNASNASASTTATGQQVNTFATSANAALDKLNTDFINLPDWQKMGIPGTIGIEQALGKFFGNDKLSTYQTTLHDARAQVTGVLATAGGMTPTSAGDTANAYLPDNMTKDQLAAKIAAVKTLIAQKVQAFQQSGAQNGTSGGNASGSGFGWNG